MDNLEAEKLGDGMFEDREQPPTDAGDVEQPEETETVGDPELAPPPIRSEDADPAESESPGISSGGPVRGLDRRESDGMSDAAVIPVDSDTKRAEKGRGNKRGQWDRELSTQGIAVELKNIEEEVRRLLEGGDSKRKRRLAGTRRWLELEEDILSLKYQGRVDEATLDTLQRLVARRHFLFGRLQFLARTRPTWNS